MPASLSRLMLCLTGLGKDRRLRNLGVRRKVVRTQEAVACVRCAVRVAGTPAGRFLILLAALGAAG